MKGLLLKDVYQMWYYTRVIILAAVVMMLVGVFGMKEGSNFFMLYGGFLLGIFPMTLLAYDQNSRFSAYSAALPVTKEQLVGSKYLIGLGAMALSELLSMAAHDSSNSRRGFRREGNGREPLQCAGRHRPASFHCRSEKYCSFNRSNRSKALREDSV